MLPKVLRLASLSNPEAILVALRRLHAYEHSVDIQSVHFQTQVVSVSEDGEEQAPLQGQEGICLSGLHIMGAIWDQEHKCLGEDPRIAEDSLFSPLPLVQITPTHRVVTRGEGAEIVFNLPLYKAHTYTGPESQPLDDYNDSVVTSIWLPTRKDPEYWVRKGTTVFAKLSDTPFR